MTSNQGCQQLGFYTFTEQGNRYRIPLLDRERTTPERVPDGFRVVGVDHDAEFYATPSIISSTIFLAIENFYPLISVEVRYMNHGDALPYRNP